MENTPKQTAVEWLIHKLRQLAHNQSTHLGMGDIRVTQGMLDDFEEQAKEMEKQQIIQAYTLGHVFHDSNDETAAEFYYKSEYENTNN